MSKISSHLSNIETNHYWVINDKLQICNETPLNTLLLIN